MPLQPLFVNAYDMKEVIHATLPHAILPKNVGTKPQSQRSEVLGSGAQGFANLAVQSKHQLAAEPRSQSRMVCSTFEHT